MKRPAAIERVWHRSEPWDLVIVGGGATGMGIAVDAASRGLQVLLCEQFDFGKGTSSRSTKLVHGGVRYLQQGNLTLVRDALKERTLLRQNAPHLVRDMPFFIPCRNRWQRFYYGVGLKVYDLLAGSHNFGRSSIIAPRVARAMVPSIRGDRFRGGVVYHDGQFDDARLLVHLARTAADSGACLLNYAPVTRLLRDSGGTVQGVALRDSESGRTIDVPARCVINAAGPFSDLVRRMSEPDSPDRIAAGQGVHLVFPARFFPGDVAMIVPKTSDGRVLFVIPWHGHAIVGTTDTPIAEIRSEPLATDAEVEFLLATMAEYLETPPTREDILSVFVGIRPLVKGDTSTRTASLSRDHSVIVEPSGLITVIGGKWTTYRKMAEDAVDRAIQHTGLGAGPCKTRQMSLHGAPSDGGSSGRVDLLTTQSAYGTDIIRLEAIESSDPSLRSLLHPDLPVSGSHVLLAVEDEMARRVEDVLARRTRCLFLNAAASVQIAPDVARRMARLLGRDEAWVNSEIEAFRAVAQHYMPPGHA